MHAAPDWLLYVGAIFLAALAFRVAGAYSRDGRASSLSARIKARRRRRKAESSSSDSE